MGILDPVEIEEAGLLWEGEGKKLFFRERGKLAGQDADPFMMDRIAHLVQLGGWDDVIGLFLLGAPLEEGGEGFDEGGFNIGADDVVTSCFPKT